MCTCLEHLLVIRSITAVLLLFPVLNEVKKIMRHTDGRCRSPIYRGTDIYGAKGVGQNPHEFAYLHKHGVLQRILVNYK